MKSRAKKPGINIEEGFEKHVFDRLYAEKPHPEFDQELHTFGQFVGIWDMEVIFYDEEGKEYYHQQNEWTFFWILDGRAIQDILLGPNMKENLSIEPGKRRIGTSLRQFDSDKNLWNVTWFGLASNDNISLSGGLENNDIILKAIDSDGIYIKWMFTNIHENDFIWKGFSSMDQGTTWNLGQQMFAKRRQKQ